MAENQRTFVAARTLITGAAAIVVIAGLKAAQAVVIPLLIAIFLAILCSPAVAWLGRKRVPTVLAVILVVLVLFAIISGAAAVVGGSVNGFIDAIPRYEERINSSLRSAAGWLDGLPFEVPTLEVFDVIQPGQMMSFLGRGLKGMVAALSNAMMVLLILVFMLLEAAILPIKLQAAMGGGTQEIERFSKAAGEVQQYLNIKTVISLCTGGVIALWVAVLGLDFALVWGLLAFLLNYIPTIGSIIAAVPAVLLALVQLGPGKAVLVAVGFLAVNFVFGNLLEPQLLGRRLGLSPLVVFLSLVFWGWVWGPLGMLLSVPITMMLKIALESSDDLRWFAVMLDSGRAARERVEREAALAEAVVSDSRNREDPANDEG
jgi:predicted PurR-regulated permease PerM